MPAIHVSFWCYALLHASTTLQMQSCCEILRLSGLPTCFFFLRTKQTARADRGASISHTEECSEVTTTDAIGRLRGAERGRIKWLTPPPPSPCNSYGKVPN